jgi:hypothetical protein
MTSLQGESKPKQAVIPDIEDDGLYDTVITAAYLGFQPPTMRNSRVTGRLAGVEAPAHVKMGTVVRYRGKTAKKWRAQFVEQIKASDHGEGAA